MAIHYKKRKWYEEVDPTFNEIIKKYLEGLRLIHIPANEGHLILNLPKDSLKKIEREGYPKFSKFYEKEDIQDVFEASKLLFADEMNDIDLKSIKKKAKKSGIHIQDLFRALLSAAELINKDKNNGYYLKSFKPWESYESLKQYISRMSEKERKKYGRKIHSDILSMTWHMSMSELDELKKENEYTQKLRMNILNSSKLIRRLLFSIWDSLSLINHKKSLHPTLPLYWDNILIIKETLKNL